MFRPKLNFPTIAGEHQTRRRAAMADDKWRRHRRRDGEAAGFPYQAGNREGMQKIKMRRSADCVVGGFRYGERPQSAGKGLIGSLLLGLYDNEGLLHHVGFTSGIKAPEKKGLTEKLEKIKADRVLPGMRLVRRAVGRRSGRPNGSRYVRSLSLKSRTTIFPGAGSATVRRSFAGGRTKSRRNARWISSRHRAEASGCGRRPRRKSGEILLAFFLWDALSFLSRLREPDRYRLLSAFDFTAFPTPATFRSAPFIAPHLAFDVAARARGIFALPFLCH